jgi:hypothetical protein
MQQKKYDFDLSPRYHVILFFHKFSTHHSADRHEEAGKPENGEPDIEESSSWKSGVNFTNLIAQSANVPVVILWYLWYRSVYRQKMLNFTSMYSLKIHLNFMQYALCCALVRSLYKYLPAQKNIDEIEPWKQFHQHFMSTFAPIILRQKSSNLKCKYKKPSRMTFVQKSDTLYVGEIDPLAQLHQHSTCSSLHDFSESVVPKLSPHRRSRHFDTREIAFFASHRIATCDVTALLTISCSYLPCQRFATFCHEDKCQIESYGVDQCFLTEVPRHICV